MDNALQQLTAQVQQNVLTTKKGTPMTNPMLVSLLSNNAILVSGG
jgi:hypothetical protein